MALLGEIYKLLRTWLYKIRVDVTTFIFLWCAKNSCKTRPCKLELLWSFSHVHACTLVSVRRRISLRCHGQSIAN